MEQQELNGIQWSEWMPRKDAAAKIGCSETHIRNIVEGKAKHHYGWAIEQRAAAKGEFGTCAWVCRIANIISGQQQVTTPQQPEHDSSIRRAPRSLLAKAGLPEPKVKLEEETWRQRCVVLMEVIGEARGVGKNSEEWREMWNILYRRARVRFGIDFKARAKQANAQSTIAYVESIDMCESLYALACEIFASTLSGEAQ